MKHANDYTLQPGWRILLKDLGIRPADVLRRAGLPDDLFTRGPISIPVEAYFRLWQGLEAEADDPILPIRIGRAITVEAFDAPIFAALCSPNLRTAAKRLSRYKALVGPMVLHVHEGESSVTLELEWLPVHLEPPAALVATELVFFVQLARLATREEISPLAVTTPRPPSPAGAYEEYLGRWVEAGSRHGVTFSAADAYRPFLTANEQMWEFFQPELRRRLCELDESATFTERVRGALLELLPGGSSSLGAVSKKLAVSTRTLQRRLRAEGGSFQQVLDTTREELARHYLSSSELTGAEISFLIGFEDPGSFFRAFQSWTGQTPESARASLRAPS